MNRRLSFATPKELAAWAQENIQPDEQETVYGAALRFKRAKAQAGGAVETAPGLSVNLPVISIPGKGLEAEEERHFSGTQAKAESTAGNEEEAQPEPFGEAFTQFSGKPAEAIEHLLRVKRGHVPAAFHKDGLGDIDLPWGYGGKDGFGLAHIIERRNEENRDGVKFVKSIPNIVQNGNVEYRGQGKNRAYIVDEKNEAVIRLDWDGEGRKWLATAYVKNIDSSSSPGRSTDLNQAYDDRKATPPNSEELTDQDTPSAPEVKREGTPAAARPEAEEAGPAPGRRL